MNQQSPMFMLTPAETTFAVPTGAFIETRNQCGNCRA